nr:MAG TPA: hypothetical protein [Inoviridae sp.]
MTCGVINPHRKSRAGLRQSEKRLEKIQPCQVAFCKNKKINSV